MSKSVNQAYKVSVFCGVAPLATGVGILLLYALTQWNWLTSAGVLTIYAGCGLFVAGVLSLILSIRKSRQEPSPVIRTIWGADWLPALILISNFPIAIFCLNVGFWLSAAYSVSIQNNSLAPLENVQISGGGCDIVIDTIPTGARNSSTFHIQHDGTLKLQMRVKSNPMSVELDSYVTNGAGGNVLVVVNPDGSADVSPSDI